MRSSINPHINLHLLAITLRDGKITRGRVVYPEPKTERGRPQKGAVHIVCTDWLDLEQYRASYVTLRESAAGLYTVDGCIFTNKQWLVVGMFERAQDDSTRAL
jgi:hypothetical protein